MKKIISIILIAIVILSISTIAFAVKSPSVADRFVPDVTASYFRVCDALGKIVKYLPIDDISCEAVKNIMDYNKMADLLYIFNFNSTYELKEGEYIEFPIHTNLIEDVDLLANMDNEEQTELTILKMVPHYWMLNITEYGTIMIKIKGVE